ncbi:DUF4160 domain-containing protein [Bifidobacterium sp. 82T10]|uniref:DUF4160 domain-containing protein n=1 Tax=Bifidobacterium miconis TaxID=2834435 RepID=A0ABS6WI86_9BIFI|nr:DUF4160 domain-containing protein [Bifidobacterium miconis]MBW3092977.1 DUF4160 domain-containing protein [Bifidobacterium miconis]
MPEIFSFAGYSVYFTALDRDHGVHVHIAQGSRHDLARFVLGADGTVSLAHNKGGLPSKDIRRLQFFLTANYEDILLAWSMFFGKDYHFDR